MSYLPLGLVLLVISCNRKTPFRKSCRIIVPFCSFAAANDYILFWLVKEKLCNGILAFKNRFTNLLNIYSVSPSVCYLFCELRPCSLLTNLDWLVYCLIKRVIPSSKIKTDINNLMDVLRTHVEIQEANKNLYNISRLQCTNLIWQTDKFSFCFYLKFLFNFLITK